MNIGANIFTSLRENTASIIRSEARRDLRIGFAPVEWVDLAIFCGDLIAGVCDLAYAIIALGYSAGVSLVAPSAITFLKASRLAQKYLIPLADKGILGRQARSDPILGARV
jgi:hypothetical protein